MAAHPKDPCHVAGMAGSMDASSLRGSNDSLEARMRAEDKLGAGDAPWDMISLKAALNKACPGGLFSWALG